MSRFLLLAPAAAIALAGCGTGEDEAAANGLPAGRTENGQLTVRAQGVDLKIDIPPPLRRMAGDDAGAFLYPGARAERVESGGNEIDRFHSDDPPETVARWYRDPARAGRFTIATVDRQGAALVLAGTARNGDALRVRLLPGPRGGTEGIVTVAAGE